MPFLTKIGCVSLLLCHLFSWSTRAQTAVIDSLPHLPSDVIPAYDTALNWYHAYLTPETGLYRGAEYASYDLRLREGNPYFIDKKRHPGTVFYDSVQYAHVLLLYDEVKDLVILYDVFNLFKINLYSELLDRFTIGDHQFIRLRDSLNPTQPHNGFYEVLYKGRISLLKKEKKIIQEDLYAGNQVEYYISGADTSYYLKKANDYYPVKNTRSLLRALKDRGKEVKKFIRSNGLSLRKDRENTLLKVSAWYDNSTPQ
jgi:hypothetical protein